MKSRVTIALSALLLFSLTGTPFAATPDEADWKQAMGTWSRLSGSKVAAERAQAVTAVGDATYDKRDKTAFGLAFAMLRQELARGKNGKKEEEVSGLVILACVDAIKKVRNESTVTKIVKSATKGRDIRLRANLARALGGIPSDDAKEALRKMVDDRAPVVSIAAVDGLREQADKSDIDLFLRVSKDEKKTWEARLGALQAVGLLGDENVCDSLVEILAALKEDEGRLRDEVLALLKKFLEVDLETDDPNAWKTAIAAKKRGEKPAEGGTKTAPTEFFGLKTKSTRIVFVLDRTGSMAAEMETEDLSTPTEEPPLESGKKISPQEKSANAQARVLKKKYDKLQVKTRLDALKKEFINTIYFLNPKVYFTVIWYEANQQPWKDQLVPATWKNKLDIIKETDKLQASGGTNVWGGLEYAFKLVANPRRPDVVKIDKKGNYATQVNGADTIFLMTDGSHNSGKFVKTNTTGNESPTDIEAMVAEVQKINRGRKVIINTVCLGSKRHPSYGKPDDKLMEKIADISGGKFSHIRDK